MKTFLREILLTVILAIVIFLVLQSTVQSFIVVGSSMQPNFQQGERLLISKVVYKFHEPEKGDVIVFHPPKNRPTEYIKRVIALPGQTVEVKDGVVYVGEFLNLMVKGLGSARRGGVQGYNLDNEPGLWSSTHPRLHPAKVTCKELLERSVALASTVKAMYPGAEVYGGVFWGLMGCAFNSKARDLDDFLSDYPKGTWFMEAFIDKMR